MINKYSNSLPGYLENSASMEKPSLKLQPFYHSDLKNNLEGVVLKQEPEKDKSILGKMLFDKTKTLKASVKALLNEIELREALDSHLIKKIDEEICKQNTYLMRLDDLKPRYMSDLTKEISKTKEHVENNVLELEKEKRKEYLECWRDLMFMKKYLLSSLKDYWNLVKKREMLDGKI